MTNLNSSLWIEGCRFYRYSKLPSAPSIHRRLDYQCLVMNMIETVSIDLGYRYADFGKAKTKTFTGHDDVDNVNFTIYGKAKRVAMHQFMLGARFTF